MAGIQEVLSVFQEAAQWLVNIMSKESKSAGPNEDCSWTQKNYDKESNTYKDDKNPWIRNKRHIVVGLRCWADFTKEGCKNTDCQRRAKQTGQVYRKCQAEIKGGDPNSRKVILQHLDPNHWWPNTPDNTPLSSPRLGTSIQISGTKLTEHLDPNPWWPDSDGETKNVCSPCESSGPTEFTPHLTKLTTAEDLFVNDNEVWCEHGPDHKVCNAFMKGKEHCIGNCSIFCHEEECRRKELATRAWRAREQARRENRAIEPARRPLARKIHGKQHETVLPKAAGSSAAGLSAQMKAKRRQCIGADMRRARSQSVDTHDRWGLSGAGMIMLLDAAQPSELNRETVGVRIGVEPGVLIDNDGRGNNCPFTS